MAMAVMLGMLLAIGLMAPAHAERFHHPYHNGWHSHHDYHRGYRNWNNGLLVGAVVGGLIYESNHSRVDVIVQPSIRYYSPNYVNHSWQIIYVREYDPG